MALPSYATAGKRTYYYSYLVFCGLVFFFLVAPIFVIINVYDIRGNKVATLLNDNLSKGNYNINWPASNHPSGLYFLRLECENYNKTNKMLLLK